MTRVRGWMCAALLAALSTMAMAQETAPKPPELTADQKAEVMKSISDIIARRVFVSGADLSQWPKYVEKHQSSIDSATSPRGFMSAVNRAFREFGFSHIRLKLQTTTTPTKPASPPDPVSTPPFWLQEPSRPAPQERKNSVTWVDTETAVLKLYSFSQGYQTKEISELAKEAAKAKYLLVDLRSNGGGATTNLRHFLSLLMPPDTEIGAFISKRDAETFLEKNEGTQVDLNKIAESKTRKYKTFKMEQPPFSGKIAVLVNRGSASASEICAAALKEQRGALIFGSRTAGAVLASVTSKLPHGFELQFPVSDYITAKGKRLEDSPIEPDFPVTGRTGDSDPVVAKAVEVLKTPSASIAKP